MSQLEQRLNSISQQISRLKKGEIAPDNTWLQKFYVPRNGKRYEYYRLMKACNRYSKTGKIQGQVEKYLGKLGSKLYKRFKAAIERRNELKRLQRIYQRLLAIFESEIISKGNAETGSIGNKPKLKQLWSAIERIEATQIQMWDWLKVFGEKIGVVVTEAASVASISSGLQSERF